jgi:peroxiredoxin Q/BCP
MQTSIISGRSRLNVMAAVKTGDAAPAFTLKNQVRSAARRNIHKTCGESGRCDHVVAGPPPPGSPHPAAAPQAGKAVNVKFGGFGAKPKVLFFFPKTATPGCTLEAKAFRDQYSQLKKLGAEVFGISGDPVEAQETFCSDLDLPFNLLSDEGDAVRKLFGVKSDLFGLLPGRETYIIGKDGVVKNVYNNQFKPESHVEEAIKALSA